MFTMYETKYTLLERMCVPNLGGIEFKALSFILHYLSHNPYGSFEVYISKAYANRSTCKTANIAP